MVLIGNIITSGISDVALPCSDTVAIGLVVDRLTASTAKNPLVRVRGRSVVIGPLHGRVQLTIINHLIARDILYQK